MWSLKTACEVNSFDPQCACISPPATILNVARNMLIPYYCWYEPCLLPNAVKTPEIIQGQKSCTITNCSITVNNIKVSGGRVIITNNCLSSVADYNVTFYNPVVWKFKLPKLGNFTLQVIAVCFLLLITGIN